MLVSALSSVSRSFSPFLSHHTINKRENTHHKQKYAQGSKLMRCRWVCVYRIGLLACALYCFIRLYFLNKHFECVWLSERARARLWWKKCPTVVVCERIAISFVSCLTCKSVLLIPNKNQTKSNRTTISKVNDASLHRRAHYIYTQTYTHTPCVCVQIGQ